MVTSDADMWHTFKDEEGRRYGCFETFLVEPGPSDINTDDALEPGWYWWACWPGCLPDGEPTGPFTTEAEAVADAQET